VIEIITVLKFENTTILGYTLYKTQYFENLYSIVKPTITDQKKEIFEWMAFSETRNI